MFRRQVLAALDAGITAGDDNAARAAVRNSSDVVTRGAVRRRLERTLIDAALVCDAAQVSRPPIAHVMRVAALAVAGSPADPSDEAAVSRAYAERRAPAMPRVPLWSIATLLVTLTVVGGTVWYLANRPGDPPRKYQRELPIPSAKAFTTGGTPLRDEAIDRLLHDELTALVVDGNKTGANDRGKLFAKLRAPEALATRPALAKAWSSAMAAFEHALGVEKPQARDNDALRETVRELSEAFIKEGLGYHLEGRFKGRFPIIQAYRVEQVVFVTTNGAPRRVLSLRRLDRLAVTYAVLGMHDEDAGDPTLHLDRIDVNVASSVLPVLAGGRPYPLGDKEWMLWPKNATLASTIGDAVRREYVAALGADGDVARQIADLLVKRGEIIEEWRDKLGRKDIYFISTDELFVPEKLLESLEGGVPNYQRKKVIEIDGTLAELEAPRVHSRIHDLVAATVRRHEAQHGFDYDRDAELRYPAALEDLLGSPFDRQGGARPVASSARAELSAYLSQVINDPITPHAALWHLVRNVFHRSQWGTGEYYAALVVLEGLAKQLGLDTSGSRRSKGQLDRDRLSVFATKLAALPDDQLRAEATKLWSSLYGEPPTKIVDVAPQPQLTAR